MPLALLNILSDRLVKLLKCRESSSEVSISSGEYSVEELLSKTLGSICESYNALGENKVETFVAINGQVYYDRSKKVNVNGDVRITLFEVGAGG